MLFRELNKNYFLLSPGLKMAGKSERFKKEKQPGVLAPEPEPEEDLKIYIPGMELEEGEELEAAPSAYYMLHSLTTEWSCLTFDILRHGPFTAEYPKYPQTAWIVCG